MIADYLRCRDVWWSYPDKTTVLKGLNLEVAEGQIVALLGSSGCGKTTLLKLIAGLLPAANGISLAGKDITRVPVHARKMGFIQENWALYPHMTVFNNCAFPLKMAKVPPDQIRRRVEDLGSMLKIRSFFGRLPHELSGGQKQRVAMARALVRTDLALLLADEPFSNLDQPLRLQLRVDFKRLQRELGLTCLIVSHDQSDAMAIADTVAFMHEGTVVQSGTAKSLLEDPHHVSVAKFLGALPMNLVSVEPGENILDRLPLGSGSSLPGGLLAGFRPEVATLSHDITSSDLIGEVVSVEKTHPRQLAVLEVGNSTIRIPIADQQVDPGALLGIKVDGPVCWFQADSGKRITVI